MNHVREENEQNLKTSSSLDRKTPVTPRTGSRTSNAGRKTPKISSTPSPLPLQSPRNFQTSRSLSQSEEHIHPKALSQTKNEKCQRASMSEGELVAEPNTVNQDMAGVKVQSSLEADKMDMVVHRDEVSITEENVFTFPKPVAQSKDDSKTPEHCQMETEEVPSHVRRIDFGEVIVIPEETDERKRENESEFNNTVNKNEKCAEEKVSESCQNNDSDSEMKTEDSNSSKTKQSRESGILSQSAGHVNLKMLLERKDFNENNLNKSLGFTSSRNTNLFSGQSSNLSRSAFVPFSQSRKEVGHQNSNVATDSSLSSSLVSYKQSVCSNSFESLPKSATITITPVINISQGATNVIDPVNRPPDNIIHIQPGSTYHNKELHSSDKAIILENKPPNGSSVIMSVSTGSKHSGDELNTNPAIIQSGSAAKDLKTLSYQISPGANKQIKTPRFTPIKPKSSPQKASSYTKTATDVPTYDKRPVSAILKEKREREKAEALAKIQASIKLPTIQSIPGLQFQQVTPALALNSGQVRNIAPLAGDMLKLQASGNLPAKDVVIFVNNSSAAPTVPAVITTSSSQCFQQPIIVASEKEEALVTEELKFGSESKANNSEEIKQTEEVNELGPDRDHTPNIEDTILSGEEKENLKGTNLKENPDEIYSDKCKTMHESMEVEKYSELKLDEPEHDQEDIFEDKLDNTELQTPAVKIAKLNVDSPFRPESACSLGRETPIKIMRTGDLSVVRPESACSLGRETPSGGRKRKSSGNTQQRNFKRLNSTGEVEDSENGCDYDLGSNLVAHQKTEIRVYNQRRTHSCTLELEKDRKHNGSSHHPKSFTLDSVPISLQSPDITSLEREALIDAFPHTVCSIQPSKHSKQKSSIGISSESFRNALKLRKQQEYLNDRVKTFLMKENTLRESAVVNEDRTSAENVNLLGEVVISNEELKGDFKSGENTVIKDRGMELESGIPSDVADFINETIEKRQSANNSVMSETNVVNDDQMQDQDIENLDTVEEAGTLVTDNVKFLGLNIVNNLKGQVTAEKQSQKQYSDQSPNDDHFTVPKVPPFNFRLRDNVRFPSPDAYSSHQRCSSLPTFTSPVSFPLSPHGRPAPGPFQRSSSISPNVGQSPDREISNISQGALRRVEIRDNHPISVNIHPNLNMTDEGTFVRPNSLPIRMAHHDEKLSQTAPYLASIQHSLQKPRETPVDPRQAKQKDSPKEKPSISSSPVARGQLSREASAERMIFTPFSDRGYHSIGNSPVLTSTPVSLSDVEALNASRHALSVGVDVISHISQASLSPQANLSQLTGSGGSQTVNINQLNTSTTSAFIPIQGSSNEIRYVTPIRPMATVAIEKMDGVVLNPNGQNQEIQNTLLCTSNRVQAPPSYEYAVRQKQRESTNTLEMVNDNMGNMGVSDKFNIEQDTVPNSSERISLLATMGQKSDQNSMKQMGPCASRLAQLSRQSKQGTDQKPSNSHPSLMSALSEPAKNVGQFFLNEQSSLTSNSPEKVPQVQHINEKNSIADPTSYNDNDLMNVAEQNFDISDMTLEPVRQSDIHTLNSNQLYRENKIMSSFGSVHSSNIRRHSGEAEISLQTKVFDPSIGMISSENVLQSSPNLKLIPPIPQKMLSNVSQKHSSFSYNTGHNVRPDDPYQDMTRQEFSDGDPLGNTLEDLKEILSDKSVVGDNGFYSETDISGNEEGIGDLLFGDE